MTNDADILPTTTGRPDGIHLIARCPYCHRTHVHGRGTGPVVADCFPETGCGQYYVIDPDRPRPPGAVFIPHAEEKK